LIPIDATLTQPVHADALAINRTLAIGTQSAWPADVIAARCKNAGREAAFDLITTRGQCGQAPQAVLRPIGPVVHRPTSAETRFSCMIGRHALRRSTAAFVNCTELFKASPIVQLSTCNAAAAPYGIAVMQTSRWSETNWLVGGTLILLLAVILLVALIEICSMSADK